MEGDNHSFLLPLPGAGRYDAVNWAAPTMSTSSAAARVAANGSNGIAASASAEVLTSSRVEGITTVTETVVVNETELNEAKEELNHLRSLYASISSTEDWSPMTAQRTAYAAEVSLSRALRTRAYCQYLLFHG